MDIANKEKSFSLINEGEERKILVSHINIRQSISLLLLRLIVLELMAAALVIFSYSFLAHTDFMERVFGDKSGIYNTIVFLIFTIGKMFLIMFVIMQWLNEYYEVNTEEIIHRRGVFFKAEERNRLDHLGLVGIDQGILGRLFNYGSLTLFNWTLEKHTSIYLIHNPIKYLKILQSLLPSVDQEKHLVGQQIVEDDKG